MICPKRSLKSLTYVQYMVPHILVSIHKIPLKGGQTLYLCVYPILYYWVLQSLLLLPLCPPSFLCWLGLKHGCDWGKRDNHVWLLSFNWWLHVMQKRITSDLVKFGKKVQPFKKHTPPLNLILWFPVMITWPPRVHHMLWKWFKEHIPIHILSSVVWVKSSVFSLQISNH